MMVELKLKDNNRYKECKRYIVLAIQIWFVISQIYILLHIMEQNLLIGIRREDKSVWERRVPLIPSDVKEILKKYPNIRIYIQPSKKRIFSDSEYKEAGAILEEDLSKCSLILGIKEVPVEKLIPDKTFVYFSHTIKAQVQNMEALDVILASNIRLIDYERIVDENNNRLIAFGRYAGIAGAIDFLKGFGQYVLMSGISTPFLHCNCAYKYFSIQDCYDHFKKIGQKIKEKKIPKEMSPMIFAVTGRGRSAEGALEVLENFPITKIKPKEIETLWADRENPKHQNTIYVVQINTEDCIEPKDPQAKFEKKDFYNNPAKYKCTFNTKFLPYITALFHCIYWENKFPRYITNKDLYELASEDKLRLIGVCDVTCDLQGSIECLQQYTTPERPFFYYDTIEDTRTFESSYKYGKILYHAVDFLPSELAFDASGHFSKLLKNWVDPLARSDKNKPLEEQALPAELTRAVIACHSKLTPSYEYIAKMREENEQKSLATKKKMEHPKEFDPSNSMMQYNVKKVKDIQGEALDFS